MHVLKPFFELWTMMRLYLRIAMMAVIPVSAARTQEAVTPQFLTDTYMEVCQTALNNFEHAAVSMLDRGWRRVASTQKNDKFQSLELVSPDRSIRAQLQKFDFGPSTFEQCSVEGYANFSEADIAETLNHSPSATGRIVINRNGSHSGLWLLTDQPTFTSLNILYNERAASIITMRTTYSGPAEVKE